LERVRLKLGKVERGVSAYQRNLIQNLKQHKTLQLLHLFRNYSALTVVVGSAFLVTGTNLASENGSGSFLLGHFQDNISESDESVAKRKFAAQSSKKESLSLVPLASASTKIDPNEKEEVSLVSNSFGGRDILALAQQPDILKDPEEDGGVKIYTVQSGDTVSGIAAKHDITVNTILWANDLDNVDSIMPGDQIFILPVAGVTHVVKEGDTLDALVEKYKGDKEKVIAFNELPADGRIEPGEEIVIPDGRKEEPTPAPDSSALARRQYATSSGTGMATDISSGFKKLEGKAGTGHKFPYGYCTWYVAQKRYVPWGGNAGTWLYNAKVLGYKTGKTPTVGSIVVTTDSPYYGHVALVEKVGKGTITVSEMNYKGWGKVNTRVIATSSRSIRGYIY
jgi:surface antigen